LAEGEAGGGGEGEERGFRGVHCCVGWCECYLDVVGIGGGVLTLCVGCESVSL
jgi:hypothetical protein